jgi:serine/threonine protein kinase
MVDLTGRDIGRYHIVERFGQGGMAEVYRAFDNRLDRDVALKVIRRDAIAPAHHEMMMKRFEREAKALARLSHPNIVKVYDFGEFEEAPYLVMELMTGGTLGQKTAGRLMEWQEAARLLAPIARALAYAHDEGILHRDVKPANILLTRQGLPMLSDFGIAKILDSETSTQLTGTNMGIGTPEYMAPEQWLGKPVPQTDIYALGVVFYELVTGRRPYSADTPAAVMLKQASDPLPRPRQFAPSLPEVVEQVLFKALAKNPQDRYASMAEFAAVLERLTQGQVEATPPQPSVVEEKPAEPAPPPALEIISTREIQSPNTVVSKSPVKIRKEGEAKPPLVIATLQPEPEAALQPMPKAEDLSRVLEPQKSRRKIPWRLLAGWVGGGIVLFGLLGVTAFILWNGRFSPAAQERGTVTAAAKIVKSTVAQAAALAALSTETPVIPPTSSQTESPSITPIPSNTSTPTRTYTPIQNFTQTLTPRGTQVSGKDGMVMVWVPAGTFEMGSISPDDESPAHSVYLDGYWMDRTEVTNGMYALCVAAGACKDQALKVNDSQQQHFPVVSIDWFNAKAYCEWAGRSLPSEAQWEKAARGTDGRMYPWGIRLECDNNYSGMCTPGIKAVGSFPAGASPYGVLDMAGNAWEWVADWYYSAYYHESPASNPQGPASGVSRSMRGGSWDGSVARCAQRLKFLPDYRSKLTGFRCALSPGY